MEWKQLSFFEEELTEDEIRLRAILKHGSGYDGGCLRIYAAEQMLDNNSFIKFLADEFYVGGHSVKNGFVDYDGRGLVIREWRTNIEWRYTWRQIAKVYHDMIRCLEFPDRKIIDLFHDAKKAGEGAPVPRMHYFGGD